MQSKIRFVALTLSLLVFGASARAETTLCTPITSVPYVVTAPGIYCLAGALSAPAGTAGINVKADDVAVDLNGHTLTVGQGGVGVMSFGRSNITVRNGTIRGGSRGVSLSGEGISGHHVERMSVERSTDAGISINGHGGVVRNSIVIGIGDAACCAKYGISVSNGTGIRVSGNQVLDTGVSSPGQVDAINVADAPGAVIERNVISNTTARAIATFGLYPAGIHVLASASSTTPMNTTVAGNRVVNMSTGILSSGGASLFLDNAVGGAATPFSGGVMAGTSNYSF